ncbi:MAG: dihydrolipoamide acetyltransferase family protein [Planctomycetota bacterium]|jgi:pyruvate/2-oxoglutarate dehydrogenase complex dihydrolipoamide acyltransferase (E2) component
MTKEFRLPDLGEGVTEGQIVRLLVAPGDHVKEDEPLMEVETDKAAVEIPSPHTGVVKTVHVTEQQVVNVGDVLVTFGEATQATAAVGTAKVAASPSAPRPAAPSAAAASGGVAAAGRAAGKTKPASPAVRKLAREMGLDLATIEGSGPGGRVLREDVERAAAPGVGAEPSAQAGIPVADRDNWGPIRREPLTRARQAIAEAMVRSKTTIPHVTDTDDADVTELDRVRRATVSPDQPDRKLTMLPFVIRATALALEKHPVFNASFDEQAGEIIYREYISIAIGVHTDRGLIAPVLRSVETKSVVQIADELAGLAEKARRASFAVNDTRGGTFTISNAGAMGGSRYSTPIINEPQSAVLALGRTRRRPWVVKDQVAPRLILPLSLSFDHRLIDGAHAVAFMQEIIGSLQDPQSLSPLVP